MSRLIRIIFCAATCLPLLGIAAESKEARWQAEFAAFSQQDQLHPPQKGGVVFVGSSSIRLWDGLETQFDRFPVVLKRGFGGSTMTECAENVQRLVLAYEPRLVVMYAGENDLVAGMTPDEVVTVRARSPKPCAARSPTSDRVRFDQAQSAASVPAATSAHERTIAPTWGPCQIRFIDVYTQMLDAQGAPRANCSATTGFT